MTNISTDRKRLKASVFIRGAVIQHFYSTSLPRLTTIATKALTEFEPGIGSLWPERFEIREHVRAIRGNLAEWKLISTTLFKDIPPQKHAWRIREVKRQALMKEGK